VVVGVTDWMIVFLLSAVLVVQTKDSASSGFALRFEVAFSDGT